MNTVSVENLQLTKVNVFKPKGTKTPSCGFCGDPANRISRCGKKNHLELYRMGLFYPTTY